MLSSAPVAPAVQTQIFERIIRKRGRECPRCGGRHRDTQYKMCEPCRNLCAAYTKAYRHDHIARKLCPYCCVDKGKQTIVCGYHREYNNNYLVLRYHDQREAGLCTWGRCQEPSEGAYCDEHKARQAEYHRKRGERARRRPWAA